LEGVTIKRVSLPEEDFVRECINIVDEAQKRGVVIRILGALAVYIKSSKNPRCKQLHKSLRESEAGIMFTDLDLMAYKKQRKDVRNFFEKYLKYIPDRYINAMFGDRRLIYYHPNNYYHVDIFLSKLEFSHDIYFGEKPGQGRLELDYPTITTTDIILEKLQIHEINKKDIVDLVVLFLSHDLSEVDEKDKINARYIAKILADDWGFWYDATNNLNKVKTFAKKFVEEGKINSHESEIIMKRVDRLLKYIDKQPKTKKWVKRSNIGTKKPWYRVVEEIER